MKNENLIQARIRKGLTQVEVAKKAGIQERAYQNYEAGRKPKSDIAIRIADVLEIKSYEKFKRLFG